MENRLTPHTYEFTWFDGVEWDDCCLYTSVRDDSRVVREFLSQQWDMGIHTEDWRVEYIGEGFEKCDMDKDSVQCNICF